MKLIIISGSSGSGKTTCLHVLEDLGFYCVDNIPASLLAVLSTRLSADNLKLDQVAVSIDARNISDDLKQFPQIYSTLKTQKIDGQIIFLDADDNPLSNDKIGLLEAIVCEKELLEPITILADLTINTTNMSLHQLRDIIKNRVAEHDSKGLALQFQSFGFKHGVPMDADMVFDARCLPNPYWIPELRPHTGLDLPVITFLEQQADVHEMFTDIKAYLERWLPRIQANNRSYITVAIGCTGGQHRSVYLCEKLKQHFNSSSYNAQVRHKELA